MNSLAVLLGGALLALSFAASPQGRTDPFEEAYVDCATARNPKGCRERRARLVARQEEVRKTCEGRPGQVEREACMREEWCREAPDPARCREFQARRDAARETCEKKPAEERQACYREAVAR